jgi:hypothetical protein
VLNTDAVSVLQSDWSRARNALRDGIDMYLDKHPRHFPTIIIDEPTLLFPASNIAIDADSPLSSIEKLKSQILGDLAKMAVVYGVDNEAKGRCARFIFSTSSATVGALLSTRF